LLVKSAIAASEAYIALQQFTNVQGCTQKVSTKFHNFIALSDADHLYYKNRSVAIWSASS